MIVTVVIAIKQLQINPKNLGLQRDSNPWPMN